MIKELFIVHHSHTDFGYTDLPSSVMAFQVEYIRQAMQMAEQTAQYPEAARFRWACEAGLVVDEFLRTAGQPDRQRFDRLVEAGQIEVTAMPCNVTSSITAAQWEGTMRRLGGVYRAYRPVTAMQNDVNGAPWGIIPSLRQAGVKYFWIGVNHYSGGTPRAVPNMWWWQGPTDARLLAWLGWSYPEGYDFFHQESWRKGPVPACHDVWFNPPSGREIFDESPEALRRAHAILLAALPRRAPDYPYEMLAVQVTNMWRIDNDPPCRQLSEFVRGWNEAKLEPALRLATPRMYMEAMESRYGMQTQTVRGDWPDWWSDGVASTPSALAVNQQAKQLAADLEPGAALLGGNVDNELLSDTWRRIALFDEHTWGAYDSIARPYAPRSVGNHVQKINLAYQAEEDARRLRAAAIRSSKAYKPFSRTRELTVLNPGNQTRSGWVEISSRAMRFDANVAEDLESGQVFPLETVYGPEWDSSPAAGAPTPPPFDVPNRDWPLQAVKSRFFVTSLAAGQRRRFALKRAKVEAAAMVKEQGRNAFYRWKWDEGTGRLIEWVDGNSGVSLIDVGEEHAMGTIVVERPKAERSILAGRNPQALAGKVNAEGPRLLSWKPGPSWYGARYYVAWEHPSCHRIEQQWDFINDCARAELTTTLWLKECADPQAIYMAMPFGLREPEASYESVGYRTRVGKDQMAGTCGEYVLVGEGVVFADKQVSIAVDCSQTPLVSFERMQTRNGQKAFVPKNAHLYCTLSHNYWITNFSITKAGKLVVKHVIQVGKDAENLLAAARSLLWAFPS